MLPFGFLNNLGQVLSSYFGPAATTVKNVFDELIPKQRPYALGSSPAPVVSPPPARSLPNAGTFAQGFANFGGNPPVATQSGQFAQAAGALPEKVDPLLPAIIALMETGGGKNLTAANNPYNIRGIQNGRSKFIDYPSLATALLGGGADNSQGFSGLVGSNPLYENYRQSGDLADFFNVFTPPGKEYGNPSLLDLILRYNAIKSLFPEF